MYFNGMEVVIIPEFKEVRARRHKKKRIDKKWLKRYGMIKIPLINLTDKKAIIFENKILIPESMWKEIRRIEDNAKRNSI